MEQPLHTIAKAFQELEKEVERVARCGKCGRFCACLLFVIHVVILLGYGLQVCR